MSDIFEALKQVAPPGSKYAEPKPVDGVRELVETAVQAIREKTRESGYSEYAIADWHDAEKYMESLIAAFINAREAGKWIPVETRLPEDGERVLVQFIFGVGVDTHLSVREGDLWECYTDESITHWQPLPLPPAPKDGE